MQITFANSFLLSVLVKICLNWKRKLKVELKLWYKKGLIYPKKRLNIEKRCVPDIEKENKTKQKWHFCATSCSNCVKYLAKFWINEQFCSVQ